MSIRSAECASIRDDVNLVQAKRPLSTGPPGAKLATDEESATKRPRTTIQTNRYVKDQGNSMSVPKETSSNKLFSREKMPALRSSQDECAQTTVLKKCADRQPRREVNGRTVSKCLIEENCRKNHAASGASSKNEDTSPGQGGMPAESNGEARKLKVDFSSSLPSDGAKKRKMKKKRKKKKKKRQNVAKRELWKKAYDDLYKCEGKLGKGTYAEVYKAIDRATGDIVAVKKFKMTGEREGFPVTALHEIRFLQKLKHDNIIRIRQVVSSRRTEKNRDRGTVHMVLDYVAFDLAALMKGNRIRMDDKLRRCYLRQLLKGIFEMHRQKIIHRDLKPENILVTRTNVLKIADLGLAKYHVNDRVRHPGQKIEYRNNVVTQWYRSPELLLGETFYGFEIDMWSVGCIFAEWFRNGRALFPAGKDDVDTQLQMIFKICGTPTGHNWPGHERLRKWPTYAGIVKQNPCKNIMDREFALLPDDARDLQKALLCLDPKRRIKAEDALAHNYFWGDQDGNVLPKELPVIRAKHAHGHAKPARKGPPHAQGGHHHRKKKASKTAGGSSGRRYRGEKRDVTESTSRSNRKGDGDAPIPSHPRRSNAKVSKKGEPKRVDRK